MEIQTLFHPLVNYLSLAKVITWTSIVLEESQSYGGELVRASHSRRFRTVPEITFYLLGDFSIAPIPLASLCTVQGRLTLEAHARWHFLMIKAKLGSLFIHGRGIVLE